MPSGPQWQGSLRDLANIVNTIRRSQAFGRLTIRNTIRLGLAHLYFRDGRLVHMVGNRGDARATLDDLRGWTRAIVRFERGIPIGNECVSNEYEQPFEALLIQLQRRGVVMVPQPPTPTPASVPESPRIVDSHLVATPQAKQLITPWEWRVLIEGTRRVSMAVAHLVGPQEAMTVLRDILDDCSAAFPAFSGLQIASSGYLQVSDISQLNRVPRAEILEGFAALIAICQYFCSPIIGEEEAHKLIIQALGDVGPTLVSLRVFQISHHLLLRKGQMK